MTSAPPGVATTEQIPWERRGEVGWWRAFRDTLVMSIREPTRFYGLVPREPTSWGALAYGLVFDVLVAVIGFAYHQLLGTTEFEGAVAPLYPQLREVWPDGPELIGKARAASAIAGLLITPLSFLFNLGLTTLMTWIGLKLARGLTTSFGRLLRMFSYASWIQLFGIVSITGDVLLSAVSFLLVLGSGSFYWLVVVRQSQGIDTRRAMLASLYGCLLAAACACVVGLPVMVALAFVLASALKSIPILPQ